VLGAVIVNEASTGTVEAGAGADADVPNAIISAPNSSVDMATDSALVQIRLDMAALLVVVVRVRCP